MVGDAVLLDQRYEIIGRKLCERRLAEMRILRDEMVVVCHRVREVAPAAA